MESGERTAKGELTPQEFKVSINRENAKNAVRDMLAFVGENPSRQGLLETPQRVMKAWEFWCSGYQQDPTEILKTFEDGAQSVDEMVMVGSIPFFSHCEHHMAPFFGYVYVAYIPQGRILGLSKFARLIEVYARRLQVQERLGVQIADAIMKGLTPMGCGVVIQARHLCMESRGIQKVGAATVTSALRGNFKDKSEVRAEFMAFVQTSMSGVKML